MNVCHSDAFNQMERPPFPSRMLHAFYDFFVSLLRQHTKIFPKYLETHFLIKKKKTTKLIL